MALYLFKFVFSAVFFVAVTTVFWSGATLKADVMLWEFLRTDTALRQVIGLYGLLLMTGTLVMALPAMVLKHKMLILTRYIAQGKFLFLLIFYALILSNGYLQWNADALLDAQRLLISLLCIVWLIWGFDDACTLFGCVLAHSAHLKRFYKVIIFNLKKVKNRAETHNTMKE